MTGSGLFNRIVKVTRIGFAARRLKNSDTNDDRLKARRALAALFEDARGVTMKFGQLMAGGEDDPLAKLVGGVDARPLSDMMPVIEQELDRPAMDVFESIEESTAAASLGQVHKARLKDGTTVAIKIQYPAIKDAVEAEMTLFGLMPSVGPVDKWGFDLGGYKSALKKNMDRELDYRDEAIRQEQFRSKVDVPGLIVSRVFTEFSARRILVQEWQEGVSLNGVARWSDDDRNSVARTLLATLL
ncbi:MAG: ABC transporter, partial [Rhodospirillaceae bacterium]|nr:ABC transporter [Rhodospirillaceae bacterium]